MGGRAVSYLDGKLARDLRAHMNDVVLQVPADPAFVHFLRSHAAGMCARAGFTIDAIDDMRLAVDEAAACLLDHAGEDSNFTNFTLEISSTENSLELCLSVDGPSDSWPPIGIESELSWKVLTALSGEVFFEIHGGRPAIRMFKSSGA